MENKKISVIVPVYNMVEHLNRAVNALLKQTYNNYEIILVDDGSTDGGDALCDHFANRYEKIKVIHKKNGGLSSARNRGIEECSGQYIIFPDPDDWVDEIYLQSLIDLKMKYDSDLEICGHYIVNSKNRVLHNASGKEIYYQKKEAILSLVKSHQYCGFAWNKLYHMDIIKKNNLRFDEELGMAQDLHFAFRYILLCNKVSYNPEPHYYYYQHEKGVTNINHPLSSRKISGLKTYEKILEIAKKEVPQAVPIVGSTIANINLHFIYIYYNSGMDDSELLNKFYETFKKNKRYYFSNKEYSVFHRILGGVALISPKLYFKVRKKKLGERT
ncbi:glycosyltransferase [uncultured Clostridium sp.]|uniref:glycosyltransferase n=1 Tax=uncultured Clostridium sp. TaxID=59620 RepID=UPI0025D7E084|nr:glycosyltransferase [uncultured Clostridium sp.]MDU2291424.1 glycosyltransferase [Clostridium celatum]MDU4325624.1 glycosyltransferase [Clostridium celatum]